MKTYHFWIRREHNGAYERINIPATSSAEAIAKLPRCVTWDFAA